MAFKVQTPKRVVSKEAESNSLQDSINYYLFNVKSDHVGLTEKKLLTIIVRKDKEKHFHFLKNETEFEVQGKWHNKRDKVYEEENAEIEVVFMDDKNGSVGNKVQKLLKEYNKKKVKEQVLYTRITPLDSSSVG